jgi:hypothetical protein
VKFFQNVSSWLFRTAMRDYRYRTGAEREASGHEKEPNRVAGLSYACLSSLICLSNGG